LKDKDKNPLLEFVAKGAAQQKAFQEVKALITYPSWMKRVAFAKVEKGQWRRRYLAAQGEVSPWTSSGRTWTKLGLDL
jgi:hypothetical protein